MAIDTISQLRGAPRLQAGRYYRPRAMLRLDVPTGAVVGDSSGGEIATILCYVRSVTLTSNSHLEADTCLAVVDWMMAGVDPRLLGSAVAVLYIGEADESGRYTPKDDDIRFVGIMKRSKRAGGEEEGMTVEILAHDYTTLFLEAKKFPTSGVPAFSDTLRAAWGKICDNTGVLNPNNPGEILPTTKALRERIRFVGQASDVLLGTAVAGRFKNLGKVQAKPNMDAWAIFQQCCGMVGLIAYIRLDECIVTTATDYYTANDPPRLIWGYNIKSLTEDRDATLGGKGIGLTSFDPMTGTSLEAFYPPQGDASIRKKTISAKRAKDPASVLQAEDREYFAYPGVTTQDALDLAARSVYEQRARQELEGRIVTNEMQIDTQSGVRFDLLQLQSGDCIRVEIDRQDTEALGQFQSDQAKADYLVGLGYDPGLARIVVANLSGVLALSPTYIVKRVVTQLDSTPEGGNFSVEITYSNKILIGSGNST